MLDCIGLFLKGMAHMDLSWEGGQPGSPMQSAPKSWNMDLW